MGDNDTTSPGRGGTYLLTWTTYGSWLCGDERGFVSDIPDGEGGYSIRNLPGEPYDFDDPSLRASALRHQAGRTVRLGPAAAAVCVAAFREVITRYGFTILAGAVMATHVHLVVDSPHAEGAKLLNLFKGVSSRRLSERFGPQESGSWWTRRGSRRLLPKERAVEAAILYVLNQPSALAMMEYDRTVSPECGIHALKSTP